MSSMKCIPLGRTMLPQWALYFPPEIFEMLMRENSHLKALGVTFLGEPAGGIAWEPGEAGGILRSIYVRPAARRLGLGSAMVTALSEWMLAGHCRRMTVSYAMRGERSLLTPFLIQCGFMMESMELPLGTATLERISDVMQKQHISRKNVDCRTLSQLSNRKLCLCREWLLQQTGEPLERYIGPNPDSFVYIREGQIRGILLFCRQKETIVLDYCWVAPDSTPAAVSLFSCAAEGFCAQYPRETRLEMILSTPSAKRLFVHFLHEPEDTITLCRGAFSPIPHYLSEVV